VALFIIVLHGPRARREEFRLGEDFYKVLRLKVVDDFLGAGRLTHIFALRSHFDEYPNERGFGNEWAINVLNETAWATDADQY